MNVQKTTDMIARLMKDEGLIPTTQGSYVTATIEPLRRLKVQAYDCFSGGFTTLGYVDRIVIRTDEIGGSRYYGRVLARTFKTNRKKGHTFNEAGILKALRELAQEMRDDAKKKRERDQRKDAEYQAKTQLRDTLERFGVDMNPSNRFDRFDGQIETRIGKVRVHVVGGETIKVEMPNFETAVQAAALLELIK